MSFTSGRAHIQHKQLRVGIRSRDQQDLTLLRYVPLRYNGSHGSSSIKDYLWTLVLATQPGQVTLACGSSKQQFTVDSGVNKLKLPLSPGRITISMVRDGRTLINQTPADFTYSSNPDLCKLEDRSLTCQSRLNMNISR